MKDLVLSWQYALVALDGQQCLHPSMAKRAVMRGIAAAKVLEKIVGKQEEWESSAFASELNRAVAKAKSLKKEEEKEIEKEMAFQLETDGLMEEIPDILGSDMDYYTADIELKTYRSKEQIYVKIREELRAEVLEDGEITGESAILLWLFRESGCIHDLFSVSEQKRVQARMAEMASENEAIRTLWQAEFYRAAENFVSHFLRAKGNLFKNPYLEGVNLLFPYLDRRKSIFIDFVIFGTNVQERRSAVINHLKERGHFVEEVKLGKETLLKIDNAYYRVVPMTKRSYTVPIQGANLVPVYW